MLFLDLALISVVLLIEEFALVVLRYHFCLFLLSVELKLLLVIEIDPLAELAL
jgi:hypothetical protein